ncbi:MAG: pyridoxal phosphate-dependent aminotransferase [Alphaproteobacteria bacterium]|nr:pyridoxal phosphate-dependent aminotransferase [Alphaproteobacteria bacterium]
MTDPAAALLAGLRPAARALPSSGIVRVFNHGRGRPGLIPMWAGEGDMPTPRLIADAAAASLACGETFYTAQLGLPELRAALARYHADIYARPFKADEFFVTGGGMQAIQIALQLILDAGEEVVIPAPAWPNFEGAIRALGGRVRTVPLRLGPAGWTLDLDALFAVCGPGVRAIFVNSPGNPTGWTASRAELRAILDFARQRGLWIVADEIYGRFHYEGGVAPSFQEIREKGDRLLFVQTFSKMWAMTGWRIGWLQAPKALAGAIESLIQYNTSGVAAFMQRAGIVALQEGRAIAGEQIARAATGREIVRQALAPLNSVRFAPPAGAFYQFFHIEGQADSMATALRLVDEANIGLAPGIAFGAEGEGHLRICFLRSATELEEAMRRLTGWLSRNAG